MGIHRPQRLHIPLLMKRNYALVVTNMVPQLLNKHLGSRWVLSVALAVPAHGATFISTNDYPQMAHGCSHPDNLCTPNKHCQWWESLHVCSAEFVVGFRRQDQARPFHYGHRPATKTSIAASLRQRPSCLPLTPSKDSSP